MSQSTITFGTTPDFSNPSVDDKLGMDRMIDRHNAANGTSLLHDTNNNRNNSFKVVLNAASLARLKETIYIMQAESDTREKVRQIKMLALTKTDAELDAIIVSMGGTP